ncbi:MAG: hypothetical protein ABIN80_13940 [Dyadobacter sp.]|uniref:hypothetical protein n=1 Tax=Dyadobacter sp. TaxID=1914288 RepID=UPI003262FDA9
MGTTQRMTPGVSGEPNWGDLNKSITHVAKTIEKEKQVENDDTISSEDSIKHFEKIETRRKAHLKSAFNNLVKTGGGRSKISGGKSSSIGKAGIKSAGRIASFFGGVGSNGLQQTLVDIGFGSLEGKSFQDVLDFLLVFCSDSNEGMDETAANNASCEIMKQLAALAENDLNKFEELVKEYVEGEGLADLLCNFWGLYIFEHLSQRFEEKVKQQKGIEIGKETFKIIKADILGQVKVLNTQRPVAKIDWKGDAGKREIEKIFDSVIKIICDENN